jgi:hypothetical protein
MMSSFKADECGALVEKYWQKKTKISTKLYLNIQFLPRSKHTPYLFKNQPINYVQVYGNFRWLL